MEYVLTYATRENGLRNIVVEAETIDSAIRIGRLIAKQVNNKEYAKQVVKLLHIDIKEDEQHD